MWSILPCRKDFEVFSLLPGVVILTMILQSSIYFYVAYELCTEQGGIADVI